MPNKVTILGIDPGYERLGLAVLEKNKESKEEIIYSECFRTNAKEDFTERLFQVGEKISELIDKFSPDTIAFEGLFFQNNQKTAMKVAEIRGMIMYLAKKNSVRIREFHPNSIKIAVTGNGKSDKKSVIYMIEKLLSIKKGSIKKLDDEYDAIAVALTCLVSKDDFPNE